MLTVLYCYINIILNKQPYIWFQNVVKQCGVHSQVVLPLILGYFN